MSLDTSIAAESMVTSHLGQMLLERMGDAQLEGQLDSIRRQSLLEDKHQLAEEARAWLEFSRATTRFYDRIKAGRNP